MDDSTRAFYEIDFGTTYILTMRAREEKAQKLRARRKKAARAKG